MLDKNKIIEKIKTAFSENSYPGDYFLQGSREGTEPEEEVGPFRGKQHWQEIEPGFLDAHASALSFFSEAGFRFFLPAYLVADLNDQLEYADPLYHLIHGFSNVEVKHDIQGQVFVLQTGGSKLLNPRRYGAATFFDYARYRLSIFTREEARAIVAYMKYKSENGDLGVEKTWIQTALDRFWLEREENAPTSEDLDEALNAEKAYLAAVRKNLGYE